MEIDFDLMISVDENAGRYFDLAKKHKKKTLGATAALADSHLRLKSLLEQEETFQRQEQIKSARVPRRKEWYEKFHWFFSSEGRLCLGGRDATSNEILIKKHLEPEDLVFHTDAPGSPFFVIKNIRSAANFPLSVSEAAQATAIYSRAWRQGHSSADVFYVTPSQITKEAKPGEYVSKGSFMVYGKRHYIHCSMECAIGEVLSDPSGPLIIGGPPSAIMHQTSNYVVLVPGDSKKSDMCKKIKAALKGGDIDEIIAFVPSGGTQIKK